jgi:hypothetical protein
LIRTNSSEVPTTGIGVPGGAAGGTGGAGTRDFGGIVPTNGRGVPGVDTAASSGAELQPKWLRM